MVEPGAGAGAGLGCLWCSCLQEQDLPDCADGGLEVEEGPYFRVINKMKWMLWLSTSMKDVKKVEQKVASQMCIEEDL